MPTHQALHPDALNNPAHHGNQTTPRPDPTSESSPPHSSAPPLPPKQQQQAPSPHSNPHPNPGSRPAAKSAPSAAGFSQVSGYSPGRRGSHPRPCAGSASPRRRACRTASWRIPARSRSRIAPCVGNGGGCRPCRGCRARARKRGLATRARCAGLLASGKCAPS